MNIATVNIADAQLLHPIAMEHARGVLDHEMKMLTSGIKKKARIEFLVAARRGMTIHRRLKDGSLEGRHVGVNHLILTESVKKYLDVEKKSRPR